MDLSDLKKKFIDEAESLLTNLDNILIELEKQPGNIQNINEAFRVMHTIKGASGMFGFEKVVETTHEVETLYGMVRDNNQAVSQELIDLTFAVADHLRAILHDENLQDRENLNRHSVIKEAIEKIKNCPVSEPLQEKEFVPVQPEPGKVATWNILFYPDEQLIKRAVNIIFTFQDLFQLGEYKINNQPFKMGSEQFWSVFLMTDQPYEEIENALMFVMDYCKITKIANFNIFDTIEFDKHKDYVKSLDNQSQDKFSGSGSTEEHTNVQNLYMPVDKTNTEIHKLSTPRISVDASKLDSLMYLVSELVTTKSELLIALQNDNIIKAMDSAEKIEKLSKHFSENALSIRLVPLHEMLHKFKRLIHDLAKQLNKKIDFVTIGDETELDKNIIDAIGEPVMHLIRNCIDHGIESPEERASNGKSETGIIKFEAIKTGNYVYITISDDGRGIDDELLYQKAVDKGFVQSGTILTQKDIYNLMFLPGFSTAESLTSVSGRGVGMDIVKKRIQDIRGEILISSSKNEGTTFTLKLQQTISIIDTMLIKAGNITYALPIEDIESCGLEARINLVDRQNNLIVFNEELIPYLNLREKFPTHTNKQVNEIEKLIVINKQHKRYALIADTIIGEYQAVVKPLGKAFEKIKFLSGASLLGDGSIAILLDTDKLWLELAE